MRCFIPAADDEIYAYIERHGIGALVPYRVGMPALQADAVAGAQPLPAEARERLPEDEPRQAA